LPGSEYGEDRHADQQGQPGAMHQLGQVGRQEQPFERKNRAADQEHAP
jgi:hypothetical protein